MLVDEFIEVLPKKNPARNRPPRHDSGASRIVEQQTAFAEVVVLGDRPQVLVIDEHVDLTFADYIESVAYAVLLYNDGAVPEVLFAECTHQFAKCVLVKHHQQLDIFENCHG